MERRFFGGHLRASLVLLLLCVTATPAGAEIAQIQELASGLSWDQYRWHVGALTVLFGQCALIVGFVVQRVERRRAEAALRASRSALRSRDQQVHTFLGRLIAAQEQERARIARELHDDLSQKLALLSIDLNQLVRETGGSELLTRRMRVAALSIDDIATGVHNLSHQLHPTRLEMLGLERALRSLCRDMSSAHKLRIEFEHQPFNGLIPYEAALCLFRVTQEALRNVVKHSASSVAEVRLSHVEGVLQLHVADSGRGFSRRSPEGGLGLVSMRERVQFVGGQMALQSTPGQGTRIHVSVPLSQDGMELPDSRRCSEIPGPSGQNSVGAQGPCSPELVMASPVSLSPRAQCAPARDLLLHQHPRHQQHGTTTLDAATRNIRVGFQNGNHARCASKSLLSSHQDL